MIFSIISEIFNKICSAPPILKSVFTSSTSIKKKIRVECFLKTIFHQNRRFRLRYVLSSVNFPRNKFHKASRTRRTTRRAKERGIFNERNFPKIRRCNLRKSSRRVFDYPAGLPTISSFAFIPETVAARAAQYRTDSGNISLCVALTTRLEARD